MSTYAEGTVSIFRLVRYDRAVNQSYIAQFVAIVLGLFLHVFPEPGSIMTWGKFNGRILPFDLLYFMALSYFVFILIMTEVRTKSPAMCMTMPLSTKRVWLSRILSMLLVSQMPIVLVTLVTAFRAPGGGEAAFLDSFTLMLGLHTCSAMAMLTMLLQLPMPELGRIVSLASYLAYTLFISAVVVFAAIVTVGITWASPVFLLAAVILFLWILMNLPASFSTMPVEPERAGMVDTGTPPAAEVASESDEAGPAVLVSPALTPKQRFLTIARVMVNKWNFWIDCFILIFYAMMAVLSYFGGEKDNPWWLFGFIWIFAALMQSVQQLNRIDFLPVSRKLAFGMTMTPVLAAITLGIGFGLLTVAVNPENSRLIDYYGGSLQIPKEFYEITEDGPPPVLTSIWGEFHEPEAYPLFKGSRRYIYKPFDTGPESSSRFIALQIDRAMEAIHGVERDPLEKYEHIEEGSDAAASQCCAGLEISMGMYSETRSRVFALAGTISAAFYLLIISLQIRYGGRNGPRSPGNFIVPASVIIIILIIGAVVLAGQAGLCKPSFVEAVPSIWMRSLADAIPFSTAFLWVAFAAVCVAGYFLLQGAYQRFEAPLAQQARKKVF